MTIGAGIHQICSLRILLIGQLCIWEKQQTDRLYAVPVDNKTGVYRVGTQFEEWPDETSLVSTAHSGTRFNVPKYNTDCDLNPYESSVHRVGFLLGNSYAPTTACCQNSRPPRQFQ